MHLLPAGSAFGPLAGFCFARWNGRRDRRGYPVPRRLSPPPSAVAFIDGQNLFDAAKEAFGYTFPNYDAPALAREVCRASGWVLEKVYFYTGIPSAPGQPILAPLLDGKAWRHGDPRRGDVLAPPQVPEPDR